MNNPQIARSFEEIADLLEILNENPFRVRSYRKAAMTIQSLPHEVREMDEAELMEIPGIGKDLAAKIKEFLSSGKMKLHEELLHKIPKGVMEIVQIPGLGPKTAKRLWDELGVTDLERLEKAARDHKIQELKGLGAKVEEKILKGVELKRKYKARHGIGKTLPLAREIVELLQKKAPVDSITIAGSLRRMQETIGDIDILVVSKKAHQVMETFVKLPLVEEVLAHGETKSSIITREGIQCDLRVVEEKSYGAALHYFTGSKAHNIRVRQIGQERGLKINEYGVFKGEKQIGGKTEEEVFASVGLPFIPPELREDRGEFEAAFAGKLPHLITLDDIRGDCHMHTNWSDGAHPIPVMVEAASKRYDYACITDHSALMGVTRGMDEARLLKQVKELRALGKKYGKFALLCGIEVDIKPDGSLDMTEKGLAELDLVVASVHLNVNMTEEEMTRRIIKAMENPFVTVIAHPTGRLIGYREPYAVNMDKVLDAAKRTGTFMELDSYWDRLDLNDVHLRMAREKGVRIMIDSDAHNTAHFDMLRFGVAQARRGWIEPDDVVNTLPTEKFLKAIKAKRQHMGKN